MDLKILPFIQQAPDQGVVRMLEDVLAKAKSGEITHVVIIHDSPTGDTKVQWQGLGTSTSIKDAVFGCEAAKVAIISKYVSASSPK
jgi:hypothetical protein